MRSWRSVVTGRPSVSVAMATYNGERYLPEMLASLAAQTRWPDELVIRDDASEDGTVALLHAFARRAPFRVDVIAGGPRSGLRPELRGGRRACSGWGDLLRRPGRHLAAAQARHGDAARTPAGRRPAGVLPRLRPRSPSDGTAVAPSYYGLLAERGFPPVAAVKGCSMAVTRGFVDLWGWPPADTPVSHDLWVALLVDRVRQRRNLPELLIDHRLHESNASGWIPDASSREFTEPGDGSGPVRLLIDLVLKPPRLAHAHPRLPRRPRRARQTRSTRWRARRLRRLLRANLRHHRERAKRRVEARRPEEPSGWSFRRGSPGVHRLAAPRRAPRA